MSRTGVTSTSEEGTMKVQVIHTPSGEEMVVMSRADYDHLREAAEDAVDAAQAAELLAHVRAGAEETVPAGVVQRLMTGEHPVKVWREHRGLTQEQLAAAVPMSRMDLSQVERGERRGSLKLLQRMAAVLTVDLDDLSVVADGAVDAAHVTD
jgi:DNA-binding XRE family transcriptional regulator